MNTSGDTRPTADAALWRREPKCPWRILFSPQLELPLTKSFHPWVLITICIRNLFFFTYHQFISPLLNLFWSILVTSFSIHPHRQRVIGPRLKRR